MTTIKSSRRLTPWLIVIVLTVAVALAAIEIARLYLERNYKDVLATEVKRKAFEVTSQTLQGNVMGSVANLGLVNQAMKNVATGKAALQDSVVLNTLQAVGELYQANGVYVVNSEGIVQSCYYTMGKTLTGVDVKFRPYFQIAKQGKQNIYAAIGTTTGKRSLYFAAPLYDKVSASSPIIGAAVARLNLDRVDSVLKAWSGHALLLSPQQITFASSRDDWIEQMAIVPTPEQIKAIRELKQFGNMFEKGTPQTLSFDIKNEIVNVDHQRYALARAPVQWNDPQGEWTLVLLGNLDELMPASLRVLIAALSGALVLALSAVFLFWRRRLQQANDERLHAEAKLQVYTRKLESDSANKSYLVKVSADLQQAASLADLARKFMHHVTSRIEADYGAFYMFDKASKRLIPIGGHGTLADELEAVGMDHGLLGQCAKEMKPIVISDSTDMPIRIVWGAGEVAPKSIILLPVTQAGQLLGMIVLAALRPIDAEKQALLETMLPMVAMNLDILSRSLGSQRMVWGNQYKVGVGVIDEQHQELIGMIATLSDAVKESRGNEILGKLLDDLINYTVYHFATEEELMKTHTYPESGAHLKEHEDLRNTVTDLQAKFKEGKATVTFQTVQLLNDWLTHHILKVDKHFAGFLNTKGIK
ncbi:MAG: bacteriohemerythrin [Gallionellaceae bacterium]|nr:bacteriohemerythrin [Gallionellaceae bacterium]